MTTTRGHGRLTKIFYTYTKFIIALRHLYSAPQKNQTRSGIKLSLHHKIVSSLLSLINLHSSAQLAQGRNYDYDSGHGRLTKIFYTYTKFTIALRHLYSAPQNNQTGSGIKLSLHHKIVSSLLSLIKLHSNAQLAQGRNYDYDSGSRQINEDFVCIYEVYNCIPSPVLCPLEKPNRKRYQTVTTPQNCIISPLSNRSYIQVHSLPRVETMTTTRGHGRLTKISYVYTKFITALCHLYTAPQKNQTGSGIKLSLHRKNVSSLLFLIKTTLKCTACLGSKLSLRLGVTVD